MFLDLQVVECDDDFLENLVIDDMIEEGLDPLNKEDILKYWKSKGIEIDG